MEERGRAHRAESGETPRQPGGSIAELRRLAAEIERLTALTTKHGSYLKLLLKERDEARQRHAQKR
jgi:hypothetical protein